MACFIRCGGAIVGYWTFYIFSYIHNLLYKNWCEPDMSFLRVFFSTIQSMSSSTYLLVDSWVFLVHEVALTWLSQRLQCNAEGLIGTKYLNFSSFQQLVFGTLGFFWEGALLLNTQRNGLNP